ncbi:MAG: hypothetical protein ACOC1F_10745, partial [Myxococcota bacterium]
TGKATGKATGAATGKANGDEASDRAALGRIAMAAVLAGLCPIIPIPFVDDLALRFVRKRSIMAELHRGGLKPGRVQMDVYLEKPTHLLGCVTALVIYPLKKIFKKVFVFLAIKDCVDAASLTFHELWLIRHAVRTGQLTTADLTVETDALLPLRRALEATTAQVDTSPLNQVLRRVFSSSKSILRQAATALAGSIRGGGGKRTDPGAVERAVDDVKPAEVAQVDELASRVGEQMWADRDYLVAVEEAFDRTWRSERGGGRSSG